MIHNLALSFICESTLATHAINSKTLRIQCTIQYNVLRILINHELYKGTIMNVCCLENLQVYRHKTQNQLIPNTNSNQYKTHSLDTAKLIDQKLLPNQFITNIQQQPTPPLSNNSKNQLTIT